MPFESRTVTLTTNYHGELATSRTDFNDAAANDVQQVLAVPAEIALSTPVISLTFEAEQAGQTYLWTITSGNGAGDFSISQSGQVFRVTGHTLNGPYALVIRYQEDSPLFRFRDIELEITTDPA